MHKPILSSRFALAVLAILLLAALSILWLTRQQGLVQIERTARDANTALAQVLGRTMARDFARLLAAAQGRSAEEMAALPEVRTLHARLTETLRATPVTKIKLYRADGITVYSTDPGQIGQDQSANPGFLAARAGGSGHELTRQGAVSAFDGDLVPGHRVSSYAPFRLEDGTMAVFEVYRDVGAWVELNDRRLWRESLPILALFAIVYLLVLFAVGRAQAETRTHLSRVEDLAARSERERGFLRTLVHTLPDLVWLQDTRGVYLACNRQFERLIGAREEDIVGRTDRDFHGHALDGLLPAGEGVDRETGALVEERWISLADGGQRVLMEITRMPMFDAGGELIGMLGIGHDITALRESADRLNEAQRIARIGSWQLDLANNRLTWSDEIFRIFEIDPTRFAASYQAFLDAIHPEDRARVDAAYQRSLETRQPYEITHRLLFPDGRVKYVRERCETRHAEDGRPLLSTGTVQDVTEQHVLHEALTTLATTLAPLSGVAFHQAVCGHLTRALGLDYAFVGRLNDTRTGVEVIAGWAKGAPMRPFAYALADTPCANVLEHGHEIHPCHVQSLFPEDVMLARMGIESYIGSALFDKRQQPMGILVALGEHPIHQPDLADRVLGLFVEAVSAELMRGRAEHRLRQTASVFEHSQEGILITDPRGTIIDVNQAFTRITGYSREEALGCNPRMLNSGRQDASFYSALWQDLQRNRYWTGEMWNRRKDGELFAVRETISAVLGEQDEVQHYVSLFSDITALKQQQAQLEHIAHFDALTHLPNRVLLADRLKQAMAQAGRHQSLVAVAYLDLDGFKAINDNHGHDVGDRLLVGLAERMKHALRQGDTLARLGGDEFVAVLLDLQSQDDSLPIVERMLAAAAQPVPVDGLDLRVSASMGVSFFPQAEDKVDADQLLRQADQAMYQAKQAGRNRYHLFDADHDREVRGRHETIDRIREALKREELVLYYQPKVNMRSGRVIGVEALIRWLHPQRGLLPPSEFLPVIEHHRLSIEVSEWVLATALDQADAWLRDGLRMPVSVNIDADHLQQPSFLDRLRGELARHPGLGPGALELEVLETVALEEIALVSRVMEACQEMGVGFALDDFGTGYSSLTYLKRLPAQLLKIDQSFVRDMLDDPDDLAILDGVLGLATAFRRQALAEGVETIAHGEMLLRLGYELGQGYAIARPMPARDLPDWVATWRPTHAWLDSPRAAREELPLLYAMADHRAWVAKLASHLRDDLAPPPPLDHHQCRFGRWLDEHGAARYAEHAGMAAILELHEAIHRQANALIALKQQGRGEEALAGLAGIGAQREELLALLLGLVDAASSRGRSGHSARDPHEDQQAAGGPIRIGRMTIPG
ncbi:MAG: EAL domain-containing protein [Thiobacillaceae bacterium]|nr:EAL domain-containing protein [Thiobacillaceae bacterium]